MGFKNRLTTVLCGVMIAISMSSPLAAQTVVHRAVAPVKVAALEPGEVKAKVAQTSAVTKQVKGRIWCVPFAREVSGINLQGNAKTWWEKAENVYPKGQKPVVGSVLNFRSTKSMPMGHVAVVSRVISERKILIDHANWQRNKVSLNMVVVDVSSRNDWSAVRVETLPNTLGSVYPTYGFIYRVAANG